MTKTFPLIAFALLALFNIAPRAACARVTVKQLYTILERDGISNSLTPDTKITSIGRVIIKNRWYSFFYFDHVTRETQHGLYRILILNDRRQYIGGYMMPDSHNCKFRKLLLICDDDNEVPHTVLDLSDGKLPARVTIDGYDTNFEK
jgi:hypothetical protein